MDYLKSVSGLLLLLLCTSILPARTWTDTKGNSFEGDFVRLTDDNQVVVKKSGTEEVYTVPMDRFSGTDQSYVKAQVEAAKKAVQGDSEEELGKKSAGELRKKREWTNSAGDKNSAKFKRIHQGTVVLMVGNRPISVPFSQFSKEDQELLRRGLKSLGREDEIPTGNGNGGGGEGYGDDGGEYGTDCYSDCGDMPEDYSCEYGEDCGDMPDGDDYTDDPMYGDGEEGSCDSYDEDYDCGACGDDYEDYDCGACGDDYEDYDCGACGEDYDCGSCGDDYEDYDSGDVAYNSPSQKSPRKKKGGSASPDYEEEEYLDGEGVLDEYDMESGEGASGVGTAFFALGAIGMLVGRLWFLGVAFKENVLWGIGCIMVPVVDLVFVASNWDKAGVPFLINLGGLGVLIMGVMLM